MTAVRVLVVAEGPSEIGRLDQVGRSGATCEGYLPPMVRKLLGPDVPVKIDAQRVTSLGRFEKKPKLAGHGDRAAKALAIAATSDYALLVFVKDVDRTPGKAKSARERRKRLADIQQQIDAGFDAVESADHVLRAKATPCRMIEAWALGDAAAIAEVGRQTASLLDVPSKPEEAWGDEADPGSKHPKCTLHRALGRSANATLFEEIATASDPTRLRKTCPESFAPFAKEMERAGDKLQRKLRR